MLLCTHPQATLQSLLLVQPPPSADVLTASLVSQHVANPTYKHALELAFRTTLHTLCSQPPTTTSPPPASPLTVLLELAVGCTPQLLDATLPFQLLEDAFDYTPLMHLPPLFAFLSSHSTSLASPALTQPRPRLALLKACNGLLRRLSKTEGAEWSGELLELLSRMMAVDERGGLNATGKFHTDNHTPVHSEPAAGSESIEADSIVDYAFYRTLWSLQSYFADPPKLKQADSLSSFLSSLDSVLTAFERSPTSAVAMSSVQSTAAYFPKYLSGPRLMHLQLQDSTFRRHLLTQSLIIFQYLLNPTADTALTLPSLAASAAASSGRPTTAGASASATTTASAGVVGASAGAGGLLAGQTSAAKEALVRVLQLLSVKVSDDGRVVDSSTDKYGEHLLELLRDELAWLRWKQAKAPTFTRPPTPLTTPIVLPNPPAKPIKRSRRGKGTQTAVLLMGGEQLSELWTSVLPNEESVRDGARSFAPSLDVKLQELLDEDDEWQQRLERWKKGQQRRDALKKEKETVKEEHKKRDDDDDEDKMAVDAAADKDDEQQQRQDEEDEEEDEPDESLLLRKDKHRQWRLLRLLRRYDFPLFQKSDGKLDKLVDELKKRRQQAADKAAKEQTERTKAAAEEAKEVATQTAADGTDAAVAVGDEESGARIEEAKDGGEGEKMEAGTDEMAQADDGMAAAPIELERKTEPTDETTVKEAEETTERAEAAERDEVEDEEDEREEARGSSRRGGEAREADSPRAAGKRRSDTADSDDDSAEGGKRRKVDDEADAQQTGDEQADRAATAAAATDEGAAATEAVADTAAAASDTQQQASDADGDSAAAASEEASSSPASSERSASSSPPPATAALADDTEMQTTE